MQVRVTESPSFMSPEGWTDTEVFLGTSMNWKIHTVKSALIRAEKSALITEDKSAWVPL